MRGEEWKLVKRNYKEKKMFEFLYGFYGFIAVKLIILHLLLTGLILYMKLLKKDGIEQIGAAIIGECLTIISWYMLPSTVSYLYLDKKLANVYL